MFTNISVVNFTKDGRIVGHCIYTGDYKSEPTILSEIYSFFLLGKDKSLFNEVTSMTIVTLFEEIWTLSPVGITRSSSYY